MSPSSRQDGIRIPTENLSQFGREPSVSSGCRKNSLQQTRIRMKTTIEFVLRLALMLPVVSTAFTMAQQPSADGVVLPLRPQGPCDIYAAAGDPCVAAHSTTRALYATYDGPLYQVLRQ